MKKRRIFTSDNLILVIAGLIGLFVVVLQFRLGLPQKWHAADTWTLVPFSVVIMVFRRYWSSWRFWGALLICLGLHLILMWEIFDRLLADVTWLGTIYVLPFEFIEVFVLIIVIAKIMKKLREPGKYIRIV